MQRIIDSERSVGEVEEALKKTKCCKAAGVDDIRMEMLKKEEKV